LASADLLSIRPNPFESSTEVVFTLPRAERVSLRVYDVAGREVASLVNGEMFEAGVRRIPFDTSRLKNGIYLARIEAGDLSAVTRLVKIH